MYVPYSTKQIGPVHISKYDHKHDKQIILLMITDNNNNWHYFSIRNISGLLRGITSNDNGDFYCLNCFHLYRTKKKLKNYERICRDHVFCYVKIPDEDKKILKYIPGEKSLKVSWIIYADLEFLLKKMDACQNNPEKSYTEKKAKHIPSGYFLATCCSLGKSTNEKKYYRGEYCMEMFCNDLENQAMKRINYEKKEIISLTNEEK